MNDKITGPTADFLNQFADRIEAEGRHEDAYKAACDASGRIGFGAAVSIAAVRLQRIYEGPLHPSAEVVLSGILFANEYGALDGPDANEKVDELILDSQTSYQALLILKYLANVMFERTDLPSLKNWTKSSLMETLDLPKQPPGVAPLKNIHRDILVIREIKTLMRFGFKPTRRRTAKSGTSGCDVVSAALGSLGKQISYSAVETIWNRRNTLPRPVHFTNLLSERINKL